MASIRTIDLDGKVKPEILASLLGVNVAMLYKYREQGKIVDWAGGKASYAECVVSYVTYLEKSNKGKVGTLADMLTEKVIRKTVAQEEEIWLDIRIKREEFGNYQEIKELIEPIFHIISSSLINIQRRFGKENPEIIKIIDGSFKALEDLGKRIADKATADGELFIKANLERKLDFDELEEIVANKYNLTPHDVSAVEVLKANFKGAD